jgi:hypothetical protein
MRSTKGICFLPEADSRGKRLNCCENGGGCRSNTVRYTRVAAVLTGIEGVVDYSGLTINGGTANIPIADDEYPVTGTVTAS